MSQRTELRVFISSTFLDLHEEREILVKKVFPDFRRLCRQRGVTFTEVDLRWGLTDEDIALGQVIRTCLEEIDRCRPYFIGITGDRYGYLPQLHEIYGDPLLLERYPWIEPVLAEGASILDLEFRHAALNNPDAARDSVAFFFRRAEDPDATSPELERLRSLQHRLRQAGFHPIEFREPGTIAELVHDYLRTILDRDFADARPPSPLEQIRREQEAFAQSRRFAYIPNPSLLNRLTTHITSDDPPLVLYAESGSGKSSLLAHWAHQLRRANPPPFVIEHYVGIGATATDHLAIIRHIMLELADRYHLKRELPPTEEALIKELPFWLAEVQGERLVLILDGLNQLGGSGHTLHWLPSFIPPNVRLVISTTVETTLTIARQRGWTTLGMQPLSEPERRALIIRYLAEFHKSLPRTIIDRLATDPKCAHPLFLRTVLEEVRLFGIHEYIADIVSTYLDTTGTEDLFQRILERIEDDFGAPYVRATFTLLWASRTGLTDQDLVALTRISRLKLSTMTAALDYHLIKQDGKLLFFHDYLRRAVEKRYNLSTDAAGSLHLQLAEYFHVQPMSDHVAAELPWQCEQCNRTDLLLQALERLDLFLVLSQQKAQYDLLGYWVRCGALDEMPTRYRTALDRFRATQSSEEYAKIIVHLSAFARIASKYSFAEELGREALELVMSLRGEDHRDTASALNTLGLVYYYTARYAEAEEFFRRALHIWERTHGEEHPNTAHTLNNLGLVYLNTARYAEAEELLRRAIHIWERTHGEEHPETAYALSNLGLVYLNTARYAEAEELFHRALQICERTHGEEHPSTVYALNNLGSVSLNTARYAEAEEFFRRALHIYEQTLGEEHPETAKALNNLAGVYFDIARYAEAEEFFRRALHIYEQTLGEEHHNTAYALSNLGLVYLNTARYAEAEELFRRALHIQERTLGEQHPETAAALIGLGSVYAGTARYTEAEELLRRALPILERTLGEEHPLTLSGTIDYAGLLAEVGRIPEAIALLEQLATRNLQNLETRGHVSLHCTAARCALATGNLDQAAAELDAITTMDTDLTDNGLYWELRGDLAAARGEQTGAAAHYRSSIAIFSAKATPHCERIQAKLSALDSHEHS
jgi:nephrocystin-3